MNEKKLRCHLFFQNFFVTLYLRLETALCKLCIVRITLHPAPCTLHLVPLKWVLCLSTQEFVKNKRLDWVPCVMMKQNRCKCASLCCFAAVSRRCEEKKKNYMKKNERENVVETNKKVNKTWLAFQRLKGCFIINDPTLML